MIFALGSHPRHQAGNAIEAKCDFRWRGGRLTISRRIWPSRTAASVDVPGFYDNRLYRALKS
jgi:hypothetical protein